MSSLISFVTNFNGANARDLLDAFPDYPVYWTVGYLLVVFYLPGYLKRHNKVYKLTAVTAAWNLFLSLFSAAGAYYSITVLYNSIFVYRDFYTTACEMVDTPAGDKLTSFTKRLHSRQWQEERPVHGSYGNFNKDHELIEKLIKRFYIGPHAFFIASFLYLKTPELLDTLFLILQGKPVSFLHWFHHIVTAIYCWQGSYVLMPAGIFFVSANYFVHSFMYFYYFLVVLGFRKKIRRFAPVITLLQCLQMFLGIGVTFYTYFQYWLGPAKEGTLFYAFFKSVFTALSFARHEAVHLLTAGSFLPAGEVPAYKMSEHFYGCETDRANLRMAVAMFGAYCVLFTVLFYELYLAKGHNKNSLVVARAERKTSTTHKATGERRKDVSQANVTHPLVSNSAGLEGR